MDLTIAALKNLANGLAKHDGVVNVTLIGFESTASSLKTINGLNASNVGILISAIEALYANGGTNYEGAFKEALKWFNSQPTTSNGKTFENVTYFLTDGDPTFSNSGSNGGWNGGSTTDYKDMKDAVDAFKGLSGKSTVHAIGIGSGVNEGYLKYFDNTKVTGTARLPIGDIGSPSPAPSASPRSSTPPANWPPRCKAVRPARIPPLSATTSSTAAPATTSSSATPSTPMATSWIGARWLAAVPPTCRKAPAWPRWTSSLS